MADPEYVLCKWRKRLWPAKVLCRSGDAGKSSISNAEETSLEVEILGLKEKVSVNSADTVQLNKEHIEDIASKLGEKTDSTEVVDELKYRCALRTALDFLSENASAGQVPELKEGVSTRLSQANNRGSLSSTPLRSCRSRFRLKEKLKPETPKKKTKSNPNLKTDAGKQNQKCSFVLEKRAKANENGTKPSKCSAGDLYNTSNSNGQNCTMPESQSLPRQKKAKSSLPTKSQTENKLVLKPKEEKSKQGRRRPGAGSPVQLPGNLPRVQGQPLAEDTSLSVPCKSYTAATVRSRTNTRRQLKMLLDLSCKSASDLEKNVRNESKNLVKQVGGGEKTSSKQLKGEQETSAPVSSCRERKCRNGREPSARPSHHRKLSDGFLSQPEEEESKDTPRALTSEVKEFQLSDFIEDEGLESSDQSLERSFIENLSHLSVLVDEDEEDEELPSILSHQEPQLIEEGILVWCKWQRYPYWPAVVRKVKRKHRKANVLFIEGNVNDKKKGFSVSLKSLKHFDCGEKQDLINQAKEEYRQEIEWCIQLISDYRIRVGCHSFTGSFLEYFADDISYPVRKQCYQGLVQMTFPNVAEENLEESLLETSPQKPSKKLLPDRTRAARDKENKKIVEFIVKTKGAEEHLLAILKSRKPSRWLKEFLNSSQYVTCIETYLEDEEQLDLVVNYLKEVYHEIDTENLRQKIGDGIKFISDVLLPEAIIYAISAVDDIDYKKAEEKYIKGPSVSKREREKFDEKILERKKLKTELESADSL
ncbi:PWWP domain-containing DNA repair factor 3A [Oxyura jamaicensis]|uniref:PWWP domain-containing DNA repair factor 3A n=1 Tax=Oxyura jamaicensis TaxID=8884 RepID=UPI0015A6E29B|nr:PWWP domain-containing DNA repair factor 3A [Oxyura jamaicensis]